MTPTEAKARPILFQNIAQELSTIACSLDEHDLDFTVSMFQAVTKQCAAYFAGRTKLTTLLWHLRQFRNEALVNDAKQAGEI